MAKTARFTIMYGLEGCYMPDSDFGHYAVTTRRDLVQAMRDALAFYDFPKAAIHQVKWLRVWDHAKRPWHFKPSFQHHPQRQRRHVLWPHRGGV